MHTHHTHSTHTTQTAHTTHTAHTHTHTYTHRDKHCLWLHVISIHVLICAVLNIHAGLYCSCQMNMINSILSVYL